MHSFCNSNLLTPDSFTPRVGTEEINRPMNDGEEFDVIEKLVNIVIIEQVKS